MPDSIKVAKYLINLSHDKSISISNLKLQKIAYIAHGYSLAINNKPLLNELPQAWKYGPVVPSIYKEFRNYNSSPIPKVEEAITLDQEDADLIEAVLTTYGKMDAMSLVELTHKSDTPWNIVWNQQNGKSQLFAEIPNELITKHFKQAYRSPQSVQGL